ncbi:MAG: DNA primase DnaG, partial [Candidatus Ranarchaeia archaeon]
AALEVVDRVGPCTARISIDHDSIIDVRKTKRKQIISKASSILRHWNETVSPESQEIADEIIKKVKIAPISKYGPESLPAGPGVNESDELIVVEGRADILNLLKCDIRNVVAVEGTKVPRSIAALTKMKSNVIAFLDGDRGGDMILKELLQVGKVDYVARAPKGKEVEDLTRKEIIKALSQKRPIVEVLKENNRASSQPSALRTIPQKVIRKKRSIIKKRATRTRDRPVRAITSVKPVSQPVNVPPEIVEVVKTLKDGEEKMQAILLDKNYKILDRIEVRALAAALKERKDVFAVVFDGVITQRIVDVTAETELKYIIGQRVGNITKKPSALRIHTLSEIKS